MTCIGRSIAARSRYGLARPEVVALAIAILGVLVVDLALIPWHPWSDSLVGLWVSPSDVLHQLLEGWTPRTLLGWDTGWGVTYVPVALVISALHAMHVPLWVCERLWLSGLLAGAAIGAFVLIGRIFPTWRWGRTAGAILYAVNPYVWVTGRDGSAILIPYVVAPFILAVLWRCRDTKRPLRAGIGLGALSLGLLAISPPASLLVLDLAVAFAVFALIRSTKAQRLTLLRTLVVAVPVGLALNLWWVLPEAANLLFHVDTTAKAVETPVTADRLASFSHTARLLGNWGIFSGWRGVPYFQDSGILQNPAVRFVSMLLPATAIGGLAAGILRRRVTSAFWLGVVAVTWAASVGAHPPIGTLYLKILPHIPGSIAFRSGFRMASILVLAYAVGVAMALEELIPHLARLARVVRVGISGGVAASILCAGLPMWLGHLEPAAKTFAIPSYWRQAATWLNTQPGPGRVLYLPPQGFSVYSWGQPMGEPALNLVHRAAVIEQPDQSAANQVGSDLATSLINDLVSGSNGEAEYLLHLLDVKYVVERNDYNWRYYSEPSPAVVLGALSTNPALSFVRQFGQLEVFETKGSPVGQAWVASHASRVLNPLVLSETTTGLTSWAQGRIDAPVDTPLSDFEVDATIQITTGTYAGIGVYGATGDGYVVAELRPDGARIEAWSNADQTSGGTVAASNSSFAAQQGIWYHVRFIRVGETCSLYVNGQLMAAGSTSAAQQAYPYVTGFSSQTSVSSFKVESAQGSPIYTMPPPSSAKPGSIPAGWRAVRSHWAIARRTEPPQLLLASANTTSLAGLRTAAVLPDDRVPPPAEHEAAPTDSIPARLVAFDQHGASAEGSLVASAPFILVFGQSYDAGWTASVNGRTLPAGDHFKAFGYANAWYVPSAGRLRLALRYRPAGLYADARYLSIASAGLIGVALLLSWRRRSAHQ